MNSLYNIRINLKLIILLLAVIVFIGKLLPMMTKFDANLKSIYMSHKRDEEFHHSAFLSNSRSGEYDSNNTIEIALVVCGDKERAQKVLPLIKTAIIYSESMLNIHLFTDSDEPREELQNIYSNFSEKITNRVKFVYHDTWFPTDNNTFWKNLYGKCATQRLFFPSLLKNLTSVMYFDSDMIIVSKLEKIWNKFADFNEREVIGASVDCGFPGCMYVNIRPWRLVPYVWEHGLNSGMLLMRLDRMREFDFETKIMKTATNPKLSWRIHGDEDIINALFHNKTEFVHRLDCTYNYFPNVYCTNRTMCDISKGIKVIHGVGNQFSQHPQRYYSLLSQMLINVDINRNPNEILNEFIVRFKYSSSDPCRFTRHSIFIEQAIPNEE